MPSSQGPIVAREEELLAVRRFVQDVGDGPASLLLEGIAGIGKTAIWRQAVDNAAAEGLTTWSCRCSESDSGWAFAGLGDLFDGVDDAYLEQLPAVQRSALSAALLLSDVAAGAMGDRVVGVAVLGVIRILARSAPLIIAVDDIQWLDGSSRKVLTFALRRLVYEPVRLIASRRSDSPADSSAADTLGLAGERIVVGPVSIGIMQRIVQQQLGRMMTRPMLTRVHRATGGNPMMSLEMARVIERRGLVPAAGEPLPIPADLGVLVIERLGGLSARTRELLLLTAAMAQPTVGTVADAVGDSTESERSLAEAVAAGILEIEDRRVRFTHPLMASIPYAELTPEARRRLHERLAATVTDPEEHARHAALGSSGPSRAVADALDVAARRARSRGSIDAAAALAELAMARTPADDPGTLLVRTVDAAQLLFLLGDGRRARSILDVGLTAAAPGPGRVKGLLLQATMASWEQGDATVISWCDQAMTEAGDDPVSVALTHVTLAETSPSGAVNDLLHARTAVELLDAMAAPPADLLAGALTNLACNQCRLGHGLAVAMLERAVALQGQGEPVPVSERAGLGLGMYLKVVDQFESSRAWLELMLAAAVDEGDDSALPITLGHLATLACWSGDYALALQYAVQGREHAARMGMRAPMPQSAHVLALAHLGRLDEARSLAFGDIAADESVGFSAAVALHRRSLGFTELSAGNPAAAADHFLRALTISSEEIGIAEPAILRLHGDAVAALVALGRLPEAQRLTDQLDASTRANHLPWSTAVAGRCHGLLDAAEGNVPRAVEFLQQAVADHEALPMPFEQARTQLLLGRMLRRSGQRRQARVALEAARAIFLRLGTPIPADEADAELAALGGWPGSTGALTPVEQRIAGLVADGQTNREVAACLFLSVRTVESHLSRIYRKLEVRSRTELAVKLPR